MTPFIFLTLPLSLTRPRTLLVPPPTLHRNAPSRQLLTREYYPPCPQETSVPSPFANASPYRGPRIGSTVCPPQHFNPGSLRGSSVHGLNSIAASLCTTPPSNVAIQLALQLWTHMATTHPSAPTEAPETADTTLWYAQSQHASQKPHVHQELNPETMARLTDQGQTSQPWLAMVAKFTLTLPSSSLSRIPDYPPQPQHRLAASTLRHWKNKGNTDTPSQQAINRYPWRFIL